PAPINAELQARVLNGAQPITCRPADLLQPEMENLTRTLLDLAAEQGFSLAEADNQIDDVLTYALFPQVGLKFLQNRNNPAAFEPVPTGKATSAVTNDKGEEVYTVSVEGKSYTVTVADGGDVTGVAAVSSMATVLEAHGDVSM